QQSRARRVAEPGRARDRGRSRRAVRDRGDAARAPLMTCNAVRLVLATANPDKAEEIAEILGPSVELLPRPDWVGEVDETGDTLEANARLKAVALVDATGEAAVADDTGLEVDALGGEPGIYTARF